MAVGVRNAQMTRAPANANAARSVEHSTTDCAACPLSHMRRFKMARQFWPAADWLQLATDELYRQGLEMRTLFQSVCTQLRKCTDTEYLLSSTVAPGMSAIAACASLTTLFIVVSSEPSSSKGSTSVSSTYAHTGLCEPQRLTRCGIPQEPGTRTAGLPACTPWQRHGADARLHWLEKLA